jgi:hypothetical protein
MGEWKNKMSNTVITFPDTRAKLFEDQPKRSRLTHWKRRMLIGNKCEIVNHLFGSAACPIDLAHLEKLTGAIISGPHFKDALHEYSVLAIIEGGRLFKSNSDNVKLVDYEMCPF